MKNTFGTSLSITLFGESHGDCIGAVLDGLAPGIVVDRDYITHKLQLRRPQDELSTARKETDEWQCVSGVFHGKTTGAPLCILIPNHDTHSQDYEMMRNIPRPGHADFAARCKYNGFEDYRGGGHFSGRITAALVAACAIVQKALEEKNIHIGTHILQCHHTFDRPFGDLSQDIRTLNERVFPVLDDEKAGSMKKEIRDAHADGDSVGGILETAVIGMPAGIGEPWFDSVESCISHALFSVPAVKGVSFGSGFSFADMTGFDANDCFQVDDGKIVTQTNHNGGINGGITNGMPLQIRCVIKPTPSIAKTQNTVNMHEKTNTTLSIQGRHDPAIIHRARPVVDGLIGLTCADLLVQHYGTNWLRG